MLPTGLRAGLVVASRLASSTAQADWYFTLRNGPWVWAEEGRWGEGNEDERRQGVWGPWWLPALAPAGLCHSPGVKASARGSTGG